MKKKPNLRRDLTKLARAMADAKPGAGQRLRKLRFVGADDGGFRETLIKVMGNKVWSAGEIEIALQQRGLLPDSKNARGYISSVLSSAQSPKDGSRIFFPVERGRYKVDTLRARKARERAAFMALLDAWTWMGSLSEKDSARVDLLMNASEEERNAVLDHLLGPEEEVG
jgi:hypothetical protein